MASWVPPVTRSLTLCGLVKVPRPASRSGFTEMIRAPRLAAFSSVLSMRGWLVPGFCPATMITSALATSAKLTVPLPMPMVWVSAEPEDSWHMFEQSGRLFVPRPRTRSW